MIELRLVNDTFSLCHQAEDKTSSDGVQTNLLCSSSDDVLHCFRWCFEEQTNLLCTSKHC